MAITKILARNSGLKAAIQYVLNGDKTQEQVLTAHLNCDPGFEYEEMMDTKRQLGKVGGRQCYHIIQSFSPGEVTPELALQIAKELAQEHLPGYQVVIGTHVDRAHVHSHILFNSVNDETGEKYHCSGKDYRQKIRAISDRICERHGLKVLENTGKSKGDSYAEWLRKSRGMPTYKTMLEADLNESIEDANTIGEFYVLMEQKGYEIKFGDRLGFRIPRQEHFMYPERRNAKYSEEGIRAAIAGNLAAIAIGAAPVFIQREQYRPYRPHPKYTGFLALYVHYLYVLGKIQKRQYPPQMTPHMKAEIMKFEAYREQFRFLGEYEVTTEIELAHVKKELNSRLQWCVKHRTILNVRKKKLKREEEKTGIASSEKAELYTELSDINREIRKLRKELKICDAIRNNVSVMEHEIQIINEPNRRRQRHEQNREHL